MQIQPSTQVDNFAKNWYISRFIHWETHNKISYKVHIL